MIVFLFLFLPFSLLAASSPANAPAAGLDRAREQGISLAARLRSMRPTESTVLTGVLTTRDSRGKRIEKTVQFRTSVGPSAWRNSYAAGDLVGTNRWAFTVVHAPDLPNEYLGDVASPDGKQAPALLLPSAIFTPFAGSDFWLADLGLEFFHWPEQRLLKTEMRQGQSCRVLESVNPKPGETDYSRVVSWIGIESGGIIHADAYDRRNKLLKVFSPKRLEKVDGQWRIRELEIRNEQTDTRSTILFDREIKVVQP
jgi:hypothetical protein